MIDSRWKRRTTSAPAKAQIVVSRASLEAARAAVREAEAIGDIARAESLIDRAADAGKDLKTARDHLREARLDQARSEPQGRPIRDPDRAEANLKAARATVAYRAKQVERLTQLADQKSIEQRLVDEQEQALTRARAAEREAEDNIGLGRARLQGRRGPAQGDRGRGRCDRAARSRIPATVVPF